MHINLRLLHMFLLVAEHSSFKQAAEEAGRSQSAVSMQIKQLEDQLGVRLFHRTTRRVQLTGEGRELLEHAKRAVGELQIGLRQIREAVDLQAGRLSFACVPTFAHSQLPSVLAEFGRRFRGVSVSVRELPAGELLTSLSRQDVDFGIGPLIPNKREFTFTPLLDEGSYALVPETLAGKAGTSVTIDEVAQWPMLTLGPNSAFRQRVDAALKAKGLTLQSRFEFSQTQTIIAMVAAGLGAAILPGMAFSGLDIKGVRAIPIDAPELNRTICLIALRGQALSPAAAKLVEIVRAVTQKNGFTLQRPRVDGNKASIRSAVTGL